MSTKKGKFEAGEEVTVFIAVKEKGINVWKTALSDEEIRDTLSLC